MTCFMVSHLIFPLLDCFYLRIYSKAVTNRNSPSDLFSCCIDHKIFDARILQIYHLRLDRNYLVSHSPDTRSSAPMKPRAYGRGFMHGRNPSIISSIGLTTNLCNCTVDEHSSCWTHLSKCIKHIYYINRIQSPAAVVVYKRL